MGAREAGSAGGRLHHLKRPTAAAATWGAGLGVRPEAEHASDPAPGAPFSRRFVPRGWCPHLRCALCVSPAPTAPGRRANHGADLNMVYAEPGWLGVARIVRDPSARQPSVRPFPSSTVPSLP